MATKKTPGPLMQKIRARVTRTKANVKEATKSAATTVRKQASGVKNAVAVMQEKRKERLQAKKAGKMRDFTTSYNVADAFQTGKAKVFDAGRPNASAGSARLKSARSRKTGPTVYKDGQAYELSRNKRKAVRELISMRTDKGAEKATPRELKQKARRDLKEIKSKPTTDAEMRKQNKKKSRRAARCIPTGKGNNLCLDQGRNNEGGY